MTVGGSEHKGSNRATFDDLFRRAGVRHADALALIDPPNCESVSGHSPRRLTFAQADRAISALAASVASRAKNFYQRAQKTLPSEDRKSMVAAELMGSVYWQLLKKLEREQFNVFGAQPLKLSRPHKLALIFQSWLGFMFGSTSSNYGQF